MAHICKGTITSLALILCCTLHGIRCHWESNLYMFSVRLGDNSVGTALSQSQPYSSSVTVNWKSFPPFSSMAEWTMPIPIRQEYTLSEHNTSKDILDLEPVYFRKSAHSKCLI